MAMWRVIAAWRSLLRRDRLERELDEELRHDLAQREQGHCRAGLSPDEAARRARQELGGPTQVREACREVRPLALLESVVQDGRYALRAMRRNPAFSLVAVTTLALAIGACTAIFSVVDGVLLRPLPYAGADSLCVIWETDRDSGTLREPASLPDYLDFITLSESFDAMGALMGAESTFTAQGMTPMRVDRLLVAETLLPMLGIQPLLGRTISGVDVESRAPVVLLSEDFWRTAFHADPDMLGRPVQIDDQPHEVIGVLPREAGFGVRQVMEAAAYGGTFAGADRRRVDVWTPLPVDPQLFPRSTHPMFILGRLAPGVTMDVAQHEMTTIAANLEAQYPENNARGAFVEPLADVVLGPSRPALLLLLGAVGLVLLVACVNVVNLLLARSSARGHEIAVRAALGAGGGRLARQFFVESAVMTLLAAAIGVGLAYTSLDLLLALAPADLPRLDSIALDLRVLGATIVISAAVAVVFGMAPSVRVRRLDVRSALTASDRGVIGGRGRHSFRSVLVVAEITLAVVLVSGAGLLIRSFWSLLSVDPGYRPDGVLKAEFTLPEARYPRDFSTWPNWPAHDAFLSAVTGDVRTAPGVQAVAFAGAHPVDRGFTNSWQVVGREAEASDWPEISVRVVSAGYVDTVGLPLIDGRDFGPGDTSATARVMLVNRAAADLYFAAGSPIDESIRMWGRNWLVVGVVGDERIHGLAESAPPAVYVPYTQAPLNAGSVLVRTTGDPMAAAPAVRAAVLAHDSQLAVFNIEPLRDTVAKSLGRRRFTMLLLGLFAAVALTLMVVGIHGVLSYAVARQMPELGIMMALGADRRRIVAAVVRRGLRLAVAGIALGVAGALAVSQSLTSLLYQVGARDALTLSAVAGLVLLSALAATVLPARRATGADPLSALRCE